MSDAKLADWALHHKSQAPSSLTNPPTQSTQASQTGLAPVAVTLETLGMPKAPIVKPDSTIDIKEATTGNTKEGKDAKGSQGATESEQVLATTGSTKEDKHGKSAGGVTESTPVLAPSAAVLARCQTITAQDHASALQYELDKLKKQHALELQKVHADYKRQIHGLKDDVLTLVQSWQVTVHTDSLRTGTLGRKRLTKRCGRVSHIESRDEYHDPTYEEVETDYWRRRTTPPQSPKSLQSTKRVYHRHDHFVHFASDS